MAIMSRNGKTWLKWVDITGNSCKLLKVAQNDWKYLEMAESGKIL